MGGGEALPPCSPGRADSPQRPEVLGLVGRLLGHGLADSGALVPISPCEYFLGAVGGKASHLSCCPHVSSR